jgi:3D (Asp-Asp-Asp) domain-containing protein
MERILQIFLNMKNTFKAIPSRVGARFAALKTNIKDKFSRVKERSAALKASATDKAKAASSSAGECFAAAKTNVSNSFKAIPGRVEAHFANLKWYFYLIDAAVILLIAAAGMFFYTSLKAPDPRITLSVTADGITTSYTVNLPEEGITVSQFLKNQNVRLDSEDELSQDKTALIEDGMNIAVTRSFPVAVRSQGEVSLITVTGGTVGDALRASGVDFDAEDELNYLSFEDLEPGMKIVHTDVVTEYTTAKRAITHKEKVVYDEDVYNDTDPVIIQHGEDGSKNVTQRVIIKDGVEVSREIVNQIIITPATDEIIKKGSKIHYQTKLTGEYRIYKKAPTAGKDGWVEMKVDYITAYCTGTRTSTGKRPKLGTIAVNTYYIPYGTEIYVPGYGYGTAQDTGAFRKYTRSDGSPVNQLDLWMNTEKECSRWGRKRNVTVLVKLG